MERKNLEIIAKDMTELLCKKNEAYGNAFEDDLDEWGLQPAAIQMGHKMKRIKSLIKGSNDNGESIKDSIMDLVGYGLLTLEWLARHPEQIKKNEIR